MAPPHRPAGTRPPDRALPARPQGAALLCWAPPPLPGAASSAPARQSEPRRAPPSPEAPPPAGNHAPPRCQWPRPSGPAREGRGGAGKGAGRERRRERSGPAVSGEPRVSRAGGTGSSSAVTGADGGICGAAAGPGRQRRSTPLPPRPRPAGSRGAPARQVPSCPAARPVAGLAAGAGTGTEGGVSSQAGPAPRRPGAPRCGHLLGQLGSDPRARARGPRGLGLRDGQVGNRPRPPPVENRPREPGSGAENSLFPSGADCAPGRAPGSQGTAKPVIYKQ